MVDLQIDGAAPFREGLPHDKTAVSRGPTVGNDLVAVAVYGIGASRRGNIAARRSFVILDFYAGLDILHIRKFSSGLIGKGEPVPGVAGELIEP